MGEISAHKIIEMLVKSSREVPTAMLRVFSIVYKGSICLSIFCFCHLERVQVNDLLVEEFSKSLSIVVIPGRKIFLVLYEEDTLNFHCDNSLRRNSDNLIPDGFHSFISNK